MVSSLHLHLKIRHFTIGFFPKVEVIFGRDRIVTLMVVHLYLVLKNTPRRLKEEEL